MKNIIFSFFVIIFTFGFIGCNDDNESSNNTARLQLILVDNPGGYLEVNVEIIDVLYNSSDDDDEGWVSLGSPDDYPVMVNLKEYTSGKSLILTDDEIPSGSLNQVRLVLGDNNTLVIEDDDGNPSEPIPLDTPSAQQSGLKLKLDTELEPGFTYSFVLDWDVQKSIVKAGNSGKYILKPVINVIAKAISGSIDGTVVGGLDVNDTDPTALENITIEVYSSTNLDVSINSTSTDDSGYFLFQGLEAGSYVLKINHTGYGPYQTEVGLEIQVVVEQTMDAGIIELLLD